MNKWQLICPSIAMVIFLLVVGIMHGRSHVRGHARHYVMSVSHTIGTELIEKTNSSLVVKIDSGLQRELASLLGAPTQVSDVLLGDEPGFMGDGSAHSRIVLTNSVGNELVIRLRPAEQSELFHVLGYRKISK